MSKGKQDWRQKYGETVTVEHIGTRERKELSVAAIYRGWRGSISALWPLCGIVEFETNSEGRGAAKMWRVLDSELSRLDLKLRDPMANGEGGDVALSDAEKRTA